MFLALTFFIIVVFFRSSLKPSNDCEDSHTHTHSISFLSILEAYPLSYKVDEEIVPNETYRFNDIIDETYSLANIIDEEFVPRVVHLELIKGATESHEDYKDFVPRSVHVELIEGSIRCNEEIEEFHGYDGYDEDNDDEYDEDDVDSSYEDDGNDDDDLKIRIDEFIAKHISKWKEEMLHDKFLYLEY
ncbi:hypothetical protein L6452_20134 [Arctium lappa]|uniref:Uncharacterized protein n=1 Tax=Arctium lappa TaxID=4217 RepID=A0ACB9BA21_ARCLA|nr:hypothetical protein L6452_20134 [Arctium lappa]